MTHNHSKLRELRERKGLTQDKLAYLSKVSLRTVQRAEAGQAVNLETLNDFAAALEVPIDTLQDATSVNGGNPMVSLRRVISARTLLDDMHRSGVARIDCTVDPAGTELEPVLAVIRLIESRLPVPHDVLARPEPLSLHQRVELAAELTKLLEKIGVLGMGVYTHAAWIEAQYPWYDPDEGCTCTMTDQDNEPVMTLQLLVCRSLAEKVYESQVSEWGLRVKRRPPSSVTPNDDDFDDLPF